MGIPCELQQLVTQDNIRELRGLGRPAFVHNDHRWVLPILAWAQLQGMLPRPSLLVMLDYHTDFAPPFLVESDEGRALIAKYNDCPHVEIAIEACGKYLDDNDGDWVASGMELGIIGDAIVFGAKSGHQAQAQSGSPYEDRDGRTHLFWPLPLPLDSLAHQGPLADHYYEPKGLWKTLGWTPAKGLLDRHSPLILDFDLDAFAFHTDLGPSFPWPDRIFRHQFLEKSLASSIKGMTGRELVGELIEHSGIVTIAREPDYCGGEADADEVFEFVNRYLFEDAGEL